METEWDKVVATHDLLAPNWKEITKGTAISLIVDCEVHTQQMMIGVSVPDGQKLRVFWRHQGTSEGM